MLVFLLESLTRLDLLAFFFLFGWCLCERLHLRRHLHHICVILCVCVWAVAISSVWH